MPNGSRRTLYLMEFNPQFANKRNRQTKKLFDEISEDQRLQNPADQFRELPFQLVRFRSCLKNELKYYQ